MVTVTEIGIPLIVKVLSKIGLAQQFDRIDSVLWSGHLRRVWFRKLQFLSWMASCLAGSSGLSEG
jgi:hypothetical protein